MGVSGPCETAEPSSRQCRLAPHAPSAAPRGPPAELLAEDEARAAILERGCGGGWIRTSVGEANGFTVRPLSHSGTPPTRDRRGKTGQHPNKIAPLSPAGVVPVLCGLARAKSIPRDVAPRAPASTAWPIAPYTIAFKPMPEPQCDIHRIEDHHVREGPRNGAGSLQTRATA